MTRLKHVAVMTLAAVALSIGCQNRDAGNSSDPLAPQGTSNNLQTSAQSSHVMVPSTRAKAQGLLSGLLGGSPYNGPFYECAADSVASTATQTIGILGGTINFGPHTLFVPPGALLKATTITATDPGNGYVTAQFQPQGLQFILPTTLTMRYGQCAVAPTGPLTVTYVQSLLGVILQILPSIDSTQSKTVTAPVWHFSVYALADRSAASSAK